jgi:hypothetical protein
MEYVFYIIELFAFILPALPHNLSTRLCILSIYFIGHCLQLQIPYKTYKKECLKN